MASKAPARGRGALERTVTHRLHRLQKLTDRASQVAYLERVGLPVGEGRVLAAVGSFSPLSVNDLAARANLDKAQASRAAQALVDRGLVRKQGDEADGRRMVLTLTEPGRDTWRRAMRIIRERNAAIVACLSAEERDQFDALLDRLVAHAGGAASDG